MKNLMESCTICPRECKVNRSLAQVGLCGMSDKIVVARIAPHYFEEPPISGVNGSGAIFFSGCNLKCIFCQNYNISTKNFGKEISVFELANKMIELQNLGVHNINLVTPTHFIPQIAQAIKIAKENGLVIPIVYNTSSYEKVSSLKLLDGLIDIYLPDLKYIRPNKSMRYSKAYDYFDKASLALNEMRRQVKDEFDRKIMKSGMIIRHLILPQNTNSSIEILDYIKSNLPDTYVSLMAQYTPCGDLSDYPEINRKITKREYDKVLNYALYNSFDKLFIQELSSADKSFIPKFDFTGVL